MSHVGKGVSGSFISHLSSSVEILYMEDSGTLHYALPISGVKKKKKIKPEKKVNYCDKSHNL